MKSDLLSKNIFEFSIYFYTTCLFVPKKKSPIEGMEQLQEVLLRFQVHA